MPDDDFPDKLKNALENLVPSSYVDTLLRERPYDGQPWTDDGERGKTLVQGLTMRDVRDCFVRACFESSGLPREQWPNTVYALPWDQIDPMAISQNLTCEIERMMGIFPNVPRIKNTWDHIPMIELDSSDEEDGLDD